MNSNLEHSDQDMVTLLNQWREIFAHRHLDSSGLKSIWAEFLADFLPAGFGVSSGCIVDSYGRFSDSLDVVVHHSSPKIEKFEYHGSRVFPVELVCGAFETCDIICQKKLDNFSIKLEKVGRLIPIGQHTAPYGGYGDSGSFNSISGGVLTAGELLDGMSFNGIEVIGSGASLPQSSAFGCAARVGLIYPIGGGKFAVYSRPDPLLDFLNLVLELAKIKESSLDFDSRHYSWLANS